MHVTVGILKRFHEEAIKRGKIPVITVIPTGLDLVFFREKGNWTYQPLLDELEQQGIKVLNFGVGIMSRLGPEDVNVLFRSISGHFNKRGYSILAGVAFDYLTERNLLVPRESRPDVLKAVSK